jgi:hypothetical protein
VNSRAHGQLGQDLGFARGELERAGRGRSAWGA